MVHLRNDRTDSSKNVSIGKTMICTTNCTLTIARIDAKSKFNTIFSEIVLTTQRFVR